jgi:hypothetical protein
MKLFILALVSLMFTAVVACGGGGTEIKVGQLVSGTITDSDDDDGEWKSQTFVIEVSEGVAYSFELTSVDDDTVGIWSADAAGYIVESNIIVPIRTETHIFTEGGSQKLFLQSPASDVPSPFLFKVKIK